ncbi:MAG: membrane dipeptidase [Pseudohongiellaceae bacterium]|jgi:membrane dipeptidase
MKKNIPTAIPIFLASFIFIISTQYSSADNALEVDQRAFHERLNTVDTHVDIPRNYATPLVDATLQSRLQVDIPKMKKGGLDTAFFVVYVDQSYRNSWEYDAVKKAALSKFNAIHRMVERSSGDIELAYSVADARESVVVQKVAFIGIENGFAIGQDLDLLGDYFDLGARYMTLVHNGHNDIGDSAQPANRFGDTKTEHNGLSEFGKKTVAEMNRLGMMVDISHASKKTMMDATLLSKSPVIASHSSAGALVDHPRNLDDEQLELIRRNGGVVQVTAVDEFLVNQSSDIWPAIERVRAALGLSEEYMELVVPEDIYKQYLSSLKNEIATNYPRANVSDFVDHIDYIVEKIGVDHVGISSDFDGGGGIIGWDNASQTPNVTYELVRRGYSESDIKKIWGDNLLRVLSENEIVSRHLKDSPKL